MRTELASLEPQRVFALFDELLNIPHASGHESQVAAWLVRVAQEHHLNARQDEVGNVIVEAPATAGREHSPLVILQGHMDMVAVKAPDSTHDFSRDPIDITCSDGFIRAKGTTLGADNGIGVCMALALLTDSTLSHGPLRGIFTVEEETTMKGALHLTKEDLQADYLVNLDSEETNELYVSCAGSCDVELRFKSERIVPQDCQGLKLKLYHLPGGHSGGDIHKGIPNAILVMGRLLRRLAEDFDFFIESAQGGTARNAIPADCTFTLGVPMAQYQEFCSSLEQEQTELAEELKLPGLRLEHQEAALDSTLSYAESMELLALLGALPNGVMAMSKVDPLVVETSSNLGIICSDEQSISLMLMPRSLHEQGLAEMQEKLQALCELTDNCEITVSNQHPCWPAKAQGQLATLVKEQFRAVTGREMHVTAMHAGLECAQYAQKNPELEQISFGPTLLNPHSIHERVEIEGVGTIFETVRRTLSVL